MWGLLLQLERDPIAKEDRRTKEELLEGSFVPAVADRLWDCEEQNRKEEFLSFIDSLPEGHFVANEEEMSVVFKEGFKQAFFKRSFAIFQDVARETTLEEFSDSFFYKVGRLRTLLDGFSDTYVTAGLEGYTSFESFVRNLNPNEKFYIGGIMHYHK